MRWQDYRHVAGALIIGNEERPAGAFDNLQKQRLGLRQRRRASKQDAMSSATAIKRLTQLSSQSSL
jgi:hypothetical protein